MFFSELQNPKIQIICIFCNLSGDFFGELKNFKYNWSIVIYFFCITIKAGLTDKICVVFFNHSPIANAGTQVIVTVLLFLKPTSQNGF